MKESLFVKYAGWLTAIIVGITTKINGGKTELTYLHKSMLREELSTDLKWSSLVVNSSVVAADVVAMDSPMPLKKRDAISTADGEIAKIGMKKQMSEKQLSDIDILINRKIDNKVIVEKIFDDAVSCTMGVNEKLEYIFLKGLSSGIGLIEDTENVGTGIRLDYGYLDANKFGVVKPWSDSTSNPLDDIQRVVKAARSKGTVIRYMMMDQNTFDNLSQNAQVREYFAFSLGFVGSNIPVPNSEQVNSMLQGKFKLQAVVVDRTVITERDGKRTVQTPWEANNVIFLDNMNVGRLMYGILAEETRQSKAATYAKAGKFILIKKWSTEEPFAEHTSSQALAVPVIDAVDGIYLLNSEEATASLDTQTEGDAVYTYKTVNYTKPSVVAAINQATGKTTAKSTNTDVTLAKYIDALNEEQVLIFEGNIVASV